jgi:hypothetical protein
VNRDKFKVGFFSFTEITDPGEHRSYNAWHMLDHLPEQYPIRGIAYGQRWVSTPACTAARAVSRPPLDATHYVTCYLMSDPVEETLAEFFELGQEMARAGRFHQHRRAVLSGPYAVVDGVAAPRVRVRPEAVPFRPHHGIYVVVAESELPAMTRALVAVDGVAGAWTFRSTREPTSESAGEPAVEARSVTVGWLDGDPVSTAVELSRLVAGLPAVRFAGPFETITPWRWDWFDEAGTGTLPPEP